jgi:hypothetical protein
MTVGVWRDIVPRLAPVSLAERRRFLALPPTPDALATAQASVAAFRQIELRQPPAATRTGNAIRVAAWNLERCLYPDEAGRILSRHRVDLALLIASAGSAAAWRPPPASSSAPSASSPAPCIWKTAPTAPAAHGRCIHCWMRWTTTPGKFRC